MTLLLAIVFGLVVWIVVWALNHSGFDAFMIAVAITLIAVGVRVLSGYLPGRRD